MTSAIGALAAISAAWGLSNLCPPAVEDKSLSPSARLKELSRVALTHDPGVLPCLELVLFDAAEIPALRAAAASYIPPLKISRDEAREALCLALVLSDLPEEALRSVAHGLADLGCGEPAAIEDSLRRLGSKPAKRNRQAVLALIAALGKSPFPSAARSLLGLLGFYRQDSSEREAILAALRPRAADLGALGATAVLRSAASSEYRNPKAVLSAIGLLSDLGDRGARPLFKRLSRHADAEVAAAAAAALARLSRD